MTAPSSRSPRGVFLVSRELGCPINLSVSTRLQNWVRQNGWAVRPAEDADDIVLVSCSTLPEMRESVQAAARHYATTYPSKRVVVTCCFLKRDAVDLPNVVYVPLAQEDDFDVLFGATVPLKAAHGGATLADDRTVRGSGAAMSRPYNVLVSAGCLNNCAFCIGKGVFPTVQSRPLATIVGEVKDGLARGYVNFVVGGSDIGSYGRDLGLDVGDLFRALFEEAFPADRKDLVVGFKGIEPSQFLRHYEKLKPWFAARRVGWVCLPIQSASDAVLEAMNRRYKAADILRAIDELRALSPGIRVETDVIVGYPTETREDFETTIRALRHFDHVQMLMFERHDTTRASALPDVFDEEERRRRAAIVQTLQAHADESYRPECPPRYDVQLPSRLGGTGFAVLEPPK